MRIFCPATLSVLFLPRFVAPDLIGNHLVCTVPNGTGDREQHSYTSRAGLTRSAAAVHLSLFSGPRGRACRSVAHSPAPKSAFRHRTERDRMRSYERTLVLLPSCMWPRPGRKARSATVTTSPFRAAKHPWPGQGNPTSMQQSTAEYNSGEFSPVERTPNLSRSSGASATARPHPGCWSGPARDPARPGPPRAQLPAQATERAGRATPEAFPAARGRSG